MNTIERTAWLEERRKGIGSSDVAPVLGLSPWRTALDVYLDKVSPVKESSKMAPYLEWGIRHEPSMAAAVMDHYGWKLGKTPTTIHREHRFLIASPDRVRLDGDGVNEIVEFKTSRMGDGFGEPETAEVPDYYWLQCQHLLEVFRETYESQVCWLFVLIGGSDFRRYRIARDEAYLPTVLDSLEEFWKRVEDRNPPEPDWQHESTVQAVRRMYDHKPNSSIELDSFAKIQADEYERLGGEIKDLSFKREESKARLIVAMQGHENGLIEDGRVVVNREIQVSGYTVQPFSKPDFRIKKGKK